jgi:hypothetical protein
VRLSDYFDAFVTSSLPLRWEALATLLSALFLVSHGLYRRVLRIFRSQSYVVGDNTTDAEKRWGWVLPFGQFVYGAAIFAFALYAGGAIFVLLAGGLLVSLLFSVVHNARTILYYRMLARYGAAQGSLTFSNSTLIRNRAQVCLEAALFFLLVGLLLPHLALLGGALIMGSTGIGYLRRARRAEAHL